MQHTSLSAALSLPLSLSVLLVSVKRFIISCNKLTNCMPSAFLSWHSPLVALCRPCFSLTSGQADWNPQKLPKKKEGKGKLRISAAKESERNWSAGRPRSECQRISCPKVFSVFNIYIYSIYFPPLTKQNFLPATWPSLGLCIQLNFRF